MFNPDTQLATRIESRIDKNVAASTGLTTGGSMAFSSIEQIMEFAKVMAIASVAVPKHLRENVGACLAVAIQASEWQMSPFAVASKTYVVNDRLAFEAQLVNAVILRRAPIKGRFKISYSGDGQSRKCKVIATLLDGDEVDYESPTFATIPVKNSPLWKSDPDQQLFYYSSRAMCRRHFPDVLLGIYTPDEMTESIDITSSTTVTPAKPIFTKLVEPKKPEPKQVEKPAEVQTEPPDEELVQQPTAQSTPSNKTAIQVASEGEEGTGVSPLDVITNLLSVSGVSENKLMNYLVGTGMAKPEQRLRDLSEKKLVNIRDSFSGIVDGLNESQ